MMIRYWLTLLLLLGVGTLPILAQVTIGSVLKPNEGALLDLKQHVPDENNVTSSKGLMLPRVRLSKLTGTLFETLNITEVLADDIHKGMLVYAIADTECPIYKSGIYTWGGSSWMMLGNANDESQYSYVEYTNEDGDIVGVVTDYEGNAHTTKRFTGVLSSDGVTPYDEIWITQNLRSLKKADGAWIDCEQGIYFNPAMSNYEQGIKVASAIPDERVHEYMNADALVPNQLYADFVGEFGLLYTVKQAKEACPDGWRLPTSDDWNKLIDYMGGEKEALFTIRRNAGKYYRPTATTGGSTWGNVTPGTVGENGFNALPSGYVQVDGKVNAFGISTNFHASDGNVYIHSNSLAWNKIYVNTTVSSMRFSVRCIKAK